MAVQINETELAYKQRRLNGYKELISESYMYKELAQRLDKRQTEILNDLINNAFFFAFEDGVTYENKRTR